MEAGTLRQAPDVRSALAALGDCAGFCWYLLEPLTLPRPSSPLAAALRGAPNGTLREESEPMLLLDLEAVL